MHQISVYRHTKEDGSKEKLIILQGNLYDKLQKKYQYMCQEGDKTFVGITILSAQMNWILLTQVQEIISGFGSYFNSMISFGTMAVWSYGIWAYYLLPINEYW